MFRHGQQQLSPARSRGLRVESLEQRTMLTAAVSDTPALWDPVGEKWYIRNSNSAGSADLWYTAPYAESNYAPVAGHFVWGTNIDWGGFYDPVKGEFHHHRTPSQGNPAVSGNGGNSFGPAGSGWLPIIGDWNGNGLVGVGLYDPVNSVFFLRNNSIGGGSADYTVSFGPAGAGWKPIVGDWNGNGQETVGLYDPVNSVFFLRNQNAPGAADLMFAYGPGGAGWTPIEGDFNGNGQHTVGLYDSVTSTFYLRNVHAGGPADVVFNYGPGGAGWKPIMGDWDRPTSPQQLDGPALEASADTRSISTADLQPIIDEAVARWSATGLDAGLAAQLAAITVKIADLPANLLGIHAPGVIVIDVNAAGHGWFVDTTPSDDSEFATGEAAGQADLLSTMMHEMGHELGLIDLDSRDNADDVMRAALPLGERFSPSAENLDEVYATLG